MLTDGDFEPDYSARKDGHTGGYVADLDTSLRYWPKGPDKRKVTIEIRQYAQSERKHTIIDMKLEYNYIWDQRIQDIGADKGSPKGWVEPWDSQDDKDRETREFQGCYQNYWDAIEAIQEYVSELPPLEAGYVFKVNGYGWGPDLGEAIEQAIMTVKAWGGYIKDGD
jgi:hypothetical protein